MHRSRILNFVAGIAIALVLTLVPAELFLRLCPPADIDPYLGDESNATGPFQADPSFAVAYRDFEDFCADRDHRSKLERFGWNGSEQTFTDKPTWAFFGNSFIHANGMLADTLRARPTNRIIFQLGHNELLPVRFAQIQTLLEAGFRPDHLFFEMMPVDVMTLCMHSLDDIYVSRKGGITYRSCLDEGPWGSWLAQSRLGLVASTRAGWQKPSYFRSYRDLHDQIHPEVQQDLARLFEGLGEITRKHSVPTTVLLIPAYDQTLGRATFGFQDTLRPIVERAGLAVLDPREAFTTVEQPNGLYIPNDFHLTAEGNSLLADQVCQYVDRHDQLVQKPQKQDTR